MNSSETIDLATSRSDGRLPASYSIKGKMSKIQTLALGHYEATCELVTSVV